MRRVLGVVFLSLLFVVGFLGTGRALEHVLQE